MNAAIPALPSYRKITPSDNRPQIALTLPKLEEAPAPTGANTGRSSGNVAGKSLKAAAPTPPSPAAGALAASNRALPASPASAPPGAVVRPLPSAAPLNAAIPALPSYRKITPSDSRPQIALTLPKEEAPAPTAQGSMTASNKSLPATAEVRAAGIKNADPFESLRAMPAPARIALKPMASNASALNPPKLKSSAAGNEAPPIRRVFRSDLDSSMDENGAAAPSSNRLAVKGDGKTTSVTAPSPLEGLRQLEEELGITFHELPKHFRLSLVIPAAAAPKVTKKDLENLAEQYKNYAELSYSEQILKKRSALISYLYEKDANSTSSLLKQVEDSQDVKFRDSFLKMNRQEAAVYDLLINKGFATESSTEGLVVIKDERKLSQPTAVKAEVIEALRRLTVTMRSFLEESKKNRASFPFLMGKFLVLFEDKETSFSLYENYYNFLKDQQPLPANAPANKLQSVKPRSVRK